MTALGIKRDYRAASYALTSAVVGVIVMRLIVYFAPLPSSTYGESLAIDALFNLPTQLLFFLIIPFCIYKFYGRKSTAELLEFSNAPRAFKPIWLLALPLGLCVWFVTIGVSSGWMSFLDLLGYNYVSSEPSMPETFNLGFFAAEVAMTAVLPAVCEEFVMRGGVLTTAKKSFDTLSCVIIGAVAFGLFHQNIRQVFYTSLFGALAAFLTIKLESIYPAAIMHFTNNFCSVFFSYARKYGWAIGGGVIDGINALGKVGFFAFLAVTIIVAAIGAGLVILMILCSHPKRKYKRPAPTVTARNIAPTVTVQNVTPTITPTDPPATEQTLPTPEQTLPTPEQTLPTPQADAAADIDTAAQAPEPSDSAVSEPTTVDVVAEASIAASAPVRNAGNAEPPSVRPLAEQRYKPDLRDTMIVAALGTVTLLTTVFTFVWGFFY